MAFVPAKALLLTLLVYCFTVLGDSVSLAESPHHNAPSYPPVEAPKQPKSHPPAPSQPPVQPPTHSPSHAPLPQRIFVAVQGVVYCKSCKYCGVDTLLEATPLVGASVKLQCNNTKNPLVQEAKTDKNGYFFMMGPKSITNFGSHKCKVSLATSPMATCKKPTNLHAGLQGAILMPQGQPPVTSLPKPPPPYQLFTVGPFAFEPSTKCSH
ncbi:Non-classical arabinogalactan protein [Actinidia chinensis var. chinensis]|uniref:Non-classical arabinogalactan protein n=1 Tax=Actinidia chinensis var. chinensis TaxID=1590841 RepID=A0A2R6QLE7_ACTCC|nr:Non-classical arabinogalactan protein [Actinidia chinensis var. chinensis]